MNQETRSCQNCKKDFIIEPDDFAFYEKMKVPPPTFCPECRAIRRMTWRNERALYRRVCGLTKQPIISCFSEESGIEVYEHNAWWSDKWDSLAYGKEYDFSKPFFTQFRELLGRIPMPALFNSRCHATTYANHSGELKNGYLVFATWGGENLFYSAKCLSSKDSIDLLSGRNCELSYEVINSDKIYHSSFIENSENCNDSMFLYNCKGCSNCFCCTNLRNKSYYIFNKAYSKEEYTRKLSEYNIGSYSSIDELKNKFRELKNTCLQRYANIIHSNNSTGDNITNCENAKWCFDVAGAKDCKFLINGAETMSNNYDGYGTGAAADLLYECIDTGAESSGTYFDIFTWGDRDTLYSCACHNSHNLFGCIGVHKNSYCILNKRYSKEEYELLVTRIIEQMKNNPYTDATGKIYKFGEFFPSELSPFAYNETIAQEYNPLTKEEVVARKLLWRDSEEKHYDTTIDSQKLPDNIRDVGEDVLNQTIGCAHATSSAGGCNHQCSTAFKIIKDELAFYRRMNLPLPRLCSNCRHYERLAQRNPVKLWHRQCMCDRTNHGHTGRCPNEFETSYSPDRPEIIYCEQCYNSEVA